MTSLIRPRSTLVARHSVRNTRALSTAPSPSKSLTEPVEPDLQHSIRALFRRTAQHVAVLTTVRPPSASASSSEPAYHGATLSSFTSISLAPLPLVSFALRLPSRAASALDRTRSSYPRPSLVINLLSAAQADVALHFSRPDLYPQPFDIHEYELTKEGLPVFPGALGALSCIPVTSFPLDWSGLAELGVHVQPELLEETQEHTSELFIAQVMRVEAARMGDGLAARPLIYHDRKFKSIGDEVTPAPSRP